MGTAKLIRLHKQDDLLSEISRLQHLVLTLQEQLQIGLLTQEDKAILIHSDGLSRYVKPSSIVMIKAESNYSTIHLFDGIKLLTSKTLKHWEGIFANTNMIRIHSSYLINKEHIVSINHRDNDILLKGGCKASISRSGKSIIKSLE